MKRVVYFFILFFTITSFLYAKEPIIIVSNDYAPYTSSSKDNSGVILDIIKVIFEEMNLDLKVQFYPWKRAEKNVKDGKAFAAVPYFKTKERIHTYNFSEPIVYSFNRFFYNEDVFPNGFEWNKLEDFQGYQMGVVLGYWYLTAFKKAKLEVQFVATDLQNLKKLSKKRIDFTVIDELAAQMLIKEHFSEGFNNIKMLKKEESFSMFYLLVSKKYPNSDEITKRFNAGLRIIKQNGKYKEILKKYNIPLSFAID